MSDYFVNLWIYFKTFFNNWTLLRPSASLGDFLQFSYDFFFRFPLLKENIYLAEKARQEKMMKKIEQQKAADLEKWL